MHRYFVDMAIAFRNPLDTHNELGPTSRALARSYVCS